MQDHILGDRANQAHTRGDREQRHSKAHARSGLSQMSGAGYHNDYKYQVLDASLALPCSNMNIFSGRTPTTSDGLMEETEWEDPDVVEEWDEVPFVYNYDANARNPIVDKYNDHPDKWAVRASRHHLWRLEHELKTWKDPKTAKAKAEHDYDLEDDSLPESQKQVKTIDWHKRRWKIKRDPNFKPWKIAMTDRNRPQSLNELALDGRGKDFDHLHDEKGIVCVKSEQITSPNYMEHPEWFREDQLVLRAYNDLVCDPANYELLQVPPNYSHKAWLWPIKKLHPKIEKRTGIGYDKVERALCRLIKRDVKHMHLLPKHDLDRATRHDEHFWIKYYNPSDARPQPYRFDR